MKKCFGYFSQRLKLRAVMALAGQRIGWLLRKKRWTPAPEKRSLRMRVADTMFRFKGFWLLLI